ncbi:MAG: NAD-dependent epimerase/dehydratase family protein [Elusimicrobia bacterium]|nr:NAD-dependent epimerase/dehydratase family protein [Elusimicrobiota bacterium]
MKHTTCLITGGAGFIGSHIARALINKGHTVLVFDNFSSGSMLNLAPVADKINIIKGDICNFNALLGAFEGVDYVFHQAALVSVPQSVQEPLQTWQINVQGTANVLEAARQKGVKRVMFACSSAIYGNGPDLPYKETAPKDCQSPYAQSKLAGLELCQMYTRVYGLETVPLIYFNVFGAGQNPNSPYAAVIAKFMQLAAQGGPLGIDWDGQQSRDFVHVRDVVQANLLAALKATAGECYNVARGETCSLLQLADLVDEISGQKLMRVFRPKRAGDVKLSSADISKIRALGYVPAVSLADGLTEMWNLQKERV